MKDARAMLRETKRIPRFMMSRMIGKMNKENKGLGLSIKMVTCTVSRLYSKANAVSNSNSYEMGDAQRGKPDRPKRKDSIKIKLLNDICTGFQYL